MSTRNILGGALLAAACGVLSAGEAVAQVYYYRTVPSEVVVSSTVVASNCTTPTPTKPSDDCHCGPSTPGTDACECKSCLDCKITLPTNCCKTSGTTRPIKNKILGTIPKRSRNISCYDFEIDFEWETDVPQVVCETQKCVGIDKMLVNCMPDCNFEVCVPVVECCDKVEKCELTKKRMKMKAKHRRNGTWDIYVINNADENSPFHAGGMPEVWLTHHCLDPEQLQREFPGQSFAAADETAEQVVEKIASKPSAKPAPKSAKSEPTTAEADRPAARATKATSVG